MFVLDSDTYTHMLHEHPRVKNNVENAALQGQVVAITIITKIEELQGRMSALLKADTHERFLDTQRRFLAEEERLRGMLTLLLDEAALCVFDALKEIRGLKKIGRADLLIASIARAKNATLVTRNQKHFRAVPQLKLANWVD